MQLLLRREQQTRPPKYLSSIKEEDDAKLFDRQTSDSFQEAVEPVTKLGEREQTDEMYIKDLERKLESHADEQKKDQNTITDLRA
ncbi:5462_t:CDS:2 [Paraglomus occultum]|uniref:5462_t:CDS:1 n=1 Tax=Paraglomus occultum TaxID=144539 RepID=A0A9N9DAY5_9GLOM|nr:5462_t:CDS:2 [Paraglomus occultum]